MMKRTRRTIRRRGHAHPLFPRIHIVISRDVTAFREAAGDKFAIEARMQKHYGGDWILIGLRFSPKAGEARAIAREISASVTKEYKPGSPVEISHGSRAFGETGPLSKTGTRKAIARAEALLKGMKS
jgi:hypothetical protein